MIKEIRPNLFLGNIDSFQPNKDLSDWDDGNLTKLGITTVVVVANDLYVPIDSEKVKTIKVGLRSDRVNSPAVKDLACHIPKYLMQNGEKVLVVSKTGLERAAYVVCRVICETELKSIYEVMQELKKLIPEYDINKSYF